MQKFKKDDEVIVTAGRDKGKRGTILQVVEPDRLLGVVNALPILLLAISVWDAQRRYQKRFWWQTW